jgi:small ligand-binding sensory domain FIST
MHWASAVSVEPFLDAAVEDAAAAVRAQLGSARADLAVVFVSAHHGAQMERVPDLVARAVAADVLIGCSAGGVIGGGREIEQRPGLSLTAAVLPQVRVFPFHVDLAAVPADVDQPAAWEQLVGVPAAQHPDFVLLSDPFTFDPEPLLRGLDAVYSGAQKIGGLASGGQERGSNALFLGQDVHRSGLIGVALTGDIRVDTIVAQGCRPIGVPMFATKCQENILWELDGRQALHVLHELYEGLDPADQELARQSLFLGIVMNDNQHEYRLGDFLIRNIAGMDPARGAIAVGAILRENSVVQFHLRDAKTSADDLDSLLRCYRADRCATLPRGALLFSCLGRGMYLYGRPDHDTEAFHRQLGNVPLGGFFCNGEIGPVGGTTFLHGYTSAFGLFRDRTE